jgi:hypothetical protein
MRLKSRELAYFMTILGRHASTGYMLADTVKLKSTSRSAETAYAMGHTILHHAFLLHKEPAHLSAVEEVTLWQVRRAVHKMLTCPYIRRLARNDELKGRQGRKRKPREFKVELDERRRAGIIVALVILSKVMLPNSPILENEILSSCQNHTMGYTTNLCDGQK